MRPQLALVDQALLRLVQELDRVLDGEDVPVLVLVDVVGHRRQRRRLAGAGRAGAQDEPARPVGELGEDLRRVQLLQRQHLGRNGAERRGGAARLVEGVDAEAGEVRDGEAEVALEAFLVRLPLVVAHDVVHHGVDVLVLHRRQVDAPDVAVHADHRRQAGRQMQVRGLVLDGEGEQFGDVHGADPYNPRIAAAYCAATRRGMQFACRNAAHADVIRLWATWRRACKRPASASTPRRGRPAAIRRRSRCWRSARPFRPRPSRRPGRPGSGDSERITCRRRWRRSTRWRVMRTSSGT